MSRERDGQTLRRKSLECFSNQFWAILTRLKTTHSCQDKPWMGKNDNKAVKSNGHRSMIFFKRTQSMPRDDTPHCYRTAQCLCENRFMRSSLRPNLTISLNQLEPWLVHPVLLSWQDYPGDFLLPYLMKVEDSWIDLKDIHLVPSALNTNGIWPSIACLWPQTILIRNSWSIIRHCTVYCER